MPATRPKAGPLARYEWREPVTPGGLATAAPPSTQTLARPTAPSAVAEQAEQSGGPVASAAPQQLPQPMTATEPAVPAVPPTVSGPSISVPPRPVASQAATPGGRQRRGPSLTDPLEPDVERWRDDVAASFPPDQVENALHVMQGESHGRPGEVGDTHPINGELAPSYGLFQIRDLEGRWREEGYPSHEAFLRAIQEPEGNIRIAAHIYRRYGWGPWTAAQNLGLAPRPHRRARRQGQR